MFYHYSCCQNMAHKAAVTPSEYRFIGVAVRLARGHTWLTMTMNAAPDTDDVRNPSRNWGSWTFIVYWCVEINKMLFPERWDSMFHNTKAWHKILCFIYFNMNKFKDMIICKIHVASFIDQSRSLKPAIVNIDSVQILKEGKKSAC